MNSISGFGRPGSKGVARKNHKARIISWTGRASRSFAREGVIPLQGRHAKA